jgi:hypothetical protein
VVDQPSREVYDFAVAIHIGLEQNEFSGVELARGRRPAKHAAHPMLAGIDFAS